jgi:hypothetical protein
MQDLALLYDEDLKTKKFKALIDLKTKIIDQHGKAGAFYLLEKENLGNLSFLEDIENNTCPWFEYKNQTTQSIVSSIWASLSKKLPTFLDLFTARCQYILTVENKGTWQLVYVLKGILEDETSFYLFYNGGTPISSEEENEHSSISNKYQGHLGLFYQVHNGFGELYRESLLPFDELSKIKVDTTFYWSFFDFVSKARQCIKVSDLTTSDPLTYDHDRGNIRAYYPFWKFLDERLSLIDEE